MKTLLASLLFVGIATGLRADDPPAKKGEDLSKPGPEHQALTKLVGEYTTATVMRMGDRPPQESKGTAKISNQLDGRFIAEESQGEMMGQKYTSGKLYGYNNGAKKYEGIWVYTGATSIMNLAGTSSDSGKTIQFTGVYEQSPGIKVTFAITMKRIDDDRFTVEMAAKNPDGSPGTTMTTTYTRKK